MLFFLFLIVYIIWYIICYIQIQEIIIIENYILLKLKNFKTQLLL